MSAAPSSVLITGGTGFLAHGLVDRLLEQGCGRIYVYSRGEHAQALMRERFSGHRALRWFIGDVRDIGQLEHAMEDIEVVIHAAALKRIEVGVYHPREMVKTNVLGSQNVIDAAKRQGVAKVLLVSSDKAFEPVSPYGQSKALAESLFLTANKVYPHGPKFSVVRYGNVWNSTGSVVPTWRALIAAGDPVVPVTDPECTRFFMRLDEAVDLVLDTIADMQGGELNVPDLPAYRLAELALAMDSCMHVVGLREWEKKHESMREGLSSDRARRMSVDELREALADV